MLSVIFSFEASRANSTRGGNHISAGLNAVQYDDDFSVSEAYKLEQVGAHPENFRLVYDAMVRPCRSACTCGVQSAVALVVLQLHRPWR